VKTLDAIILDAYREGIFPMAESAEDEGFAFYRPQMRALLPIAELHIPARLLKTIRRRKFTVTMNRAFPDVIDACAAVRSAKRDNTWINQPIRDIFVMLHERGHAHSIECWNADGSLAGGLYGLAIGAVFCGESMFSNTRDASKIALVHLCALLHASDFTLLDSQFMNPHLLQFGAYEMSQDEYEERIKTEMNRAVLFSKDPLEKILEDYLEFRKF